MSKRENVEPLRSQEEIQDFLFCLRRSHNPDRDTFLFRLGINTGLRMSDLVTLKVKDISHSINPKIREKKTGKTRTLYLANLQEEISIYIEGKNQDDWLFPSRQGENQHIKVNTVYQLYQRVADQLGRNDIGTHSVRKTFGYHYYRNTRDIATLMEVFNHASQQITKRYIGIREEEIGETFKSFKIG
ncbi:integrase [Enterococcus sp. PF1-24]|uniref:tyrosine-type recombinase/integrase n=1 Tax=unclassified Enterococcus TaxID=2608891 RepID=UPI0024745AF6|nr:MULTISPECIES: tyrosine-type recombinase/integrase [unclassified Enterococcus]MDH6363500.1 integrase [Enterococcus sp. PFB1-1]MDH6400594.1 integrase [Enterococcus sp. PF1-24]